MARKSRRRKRKSISDLNITNLVDVVFALLIIFMITAPMMTQGVQVDLPRANADNVETSADLIDIVITRESEITINGEAVALVSFGGTFSRILAGNLQTPVYISADHEVPYGLVVRVISEVKNAGALRLGFMTQPLSGDRR